MITYIIKNVGEFIITNNKMAKATKCYKKVVLKDLESKKLYNVILKNDDAKISLEMNQYVMADLRKDYSSPQWNNVYDVITFKPLPIQKTSIFRSEFIVLWLGEPYFDKENVDNGIELKRKILLELPHECYGDEFYCTLLDKDALLPLKEGDLIEATLTFQISDDDGDFHQNIYLGNVVKL